MKKLTVVPKQQINLNSPLLTRTIEYVKDSKDYNKFKVLDEFNRPVKKSHVKLLLQAIIMTAFIGEITIIKTKAFGGGIKLIRGDGQHRMVVAESLNLPFNYRIVELVHDTRDNVVDFICTLNDNQLPWSNTDFLTSQAAKGLYEYNVFLTKKEETKLTLSDLKYIYLGKNTGDHKTYRKGTMKFLDEKGSDRLLAAVIKVLPHIPNKSFTRRSLYKAMRTFGDYNTVANIIIKAKKNLDLVKRSFSENEHEFLNHICQLCDGKIMIINRDSLVAA